MTRPFWVKATALTTALVACLAFGVATAPGEDGPHAKLGQYVGRWKTTFTREEAGQRMESARGVVFVQSVCKGRVLRFQCTDSRHGGNGSDILLGWDAARRQYDQISVGLDAPPFLSHGSLTADGKMVRFEPVQGIEHESRQRIQIVTTLGVPENGAFDAVGLLQLADGRLISRTTVHYERLGTGDCGATGRDRARC